LVSIRKKLQNRPISFATVAVLTPQGQKKTRGTSLSVSHQRRPSQNRLLSFATVAVLELFLHEIIKLFPLLNP